MTFTEYRRAIAAIQDTNEGLFAFVATLTIIYLLFVIPQQPFPWQFLTAPLTVAAIALCFLRQHNLVPPTGWHSLIGIPLVRVAPERLADNIRRGLRFGLGMAACITLVNWYFLTPYHIEISHAPAERMDSLVMVTWSSLQAGIGEELIFRGVLVTGLWVLLRPLFRSPRLLVFALAFASVGLFELAHYARTPVGHLLLSPISISFFYLFWTTGQRLAAPIAAHVSYDLLVYVVDWFSGRVSP